MALSKQLARALSGPERRRYERCRVDLTAIVWNATLAGTSQSDDTSLSRRISIEDLSLSGVAFYTSVPYRLKSMLWLRLRLGARSVSIKLVIRRVRPAQVSGQNCYACGAEFFSCPETLDATPILITYLRQHGLSTSG